MQGAQNIKPVLIFPESLNCYLPKHSQGNRETLTGTHSQKNTHRETKHVPGEARALLAAYSNTTLL
jgi:hypothetical protein